MSADGAFGVEHGGAPAAGVRAARDPHSLVSTRLTRELIAADARSDQEGDDVAARVARLLDAALSGLSVPTGAILRYDSALGSPRCLAMQSVPAPAIELLEARGPSESPSESLARRACAERRVFLLDRASREPLMSALRADVPDLASAAVIPLYDRGVPVAAILLAAGDPRPLQASSLRLLAPAFHLLGVLLSPGRGAPFARADATGEGGDQERYLVEIEELGNLLRESREAARVAAEQAAAAQAEQRAEVEAYRARIAELEASASHGDVESSLRRDLESALHLEARKLEERDRLILELEDEVRRLQRRIASLEAERDARASAPVVASLDDAADDAAVGDARLQEMANAAAAALADAPSEPGSDGLATDEAAEDMDADAEPIGIDDLADAATEDVVGDGADLDGEDAAVCAEPSDAVAPAHPSVVFALEGDAEMRAGLAAAAERCGVASWFGDGEPPPARGILVANLFAAGLHGCAEMLAAARGEGAGIAYGHDAETQSGVEIGPVLWLARPVDAPTAVARVRAVVPGKAGGIVIISSQLRELAPMREALSSAGVSSSVACDSRQAVDLLEIVRRPDAILIDLGLDAGQGVTIAAHCRGQSEVRDIPLLLLLPREPEPERLVAAARRAGALAPFGAAEVARMLTAALSR